MDTVWTHIRLRKTTVDRLRREAAHLIRLYVEGRYDLPNAGEGLSMDWLINNLLNTRDGHRRRARRQAERRRGKG